MDVIALEDLKRRAGQTAKGSTNWHFHLLTPTCKLNPSSDFALVLEVDGQTAVHYSNEAPKQASKELAKLLHGAKTFDEEPAANTSNPTDFKKLLNRAEELSTKNIPWHHHMLYPSCTFSIEPKKWIIMLEDPNQSETLSCAFDKDPKEAIKLIERLFYNQQQLT